MQNLILYIHGLGGGADSRIPSILSETLTDATVIVRTYDFKPDVAVGQIQSWIDELHPDLVIGESLGSVHALNLWKGPLILVSPALLAPVIFSKYDYLSKSALVRAFLDWKFKPKRPNRQKVHFSYETMHAWTPFREKIIKPRQAPIWAFFGNHDHYMKQGVVSIEDYEKHFGMTYTVYEGSHFMENNYVTSILVEKIREFLSDADL